MKGDWTAELWINVFVNWIIVISSEIDQIQVTGKRILEYRGQSLCTRNFLEELYSLVINKKNLISLIHLFLIINQWLILFDIIIKKVYVSNFLTKRIVLKKSFWTY